MHHSKLFSQFAVSGTNTIEMLGDYSTISGNFRIATTGTELLVITRMMVSVEDTGSFDAEKYGNGIVCTNGIQVVVHDWDDSLIYPLVNGAHPIKTNADWGAYCYDVDVKDWGTGNEFLVARWTFAKHGAPIYLRGKGELGGEHIDVLLNDIYTGLVHHHMLFQGHYLSQ